jgi:hypothetical protein
MDHGASWVLTLAEHDQAALMSLCALMWLVSLFRAVSSCKLAVSRRWFRRSKAT